MSADPSHVSSSHTPLPQTKEEADHLMRGNPDDEDISVTGLHATILREKEDPVDGEEPVPSWLIILFGLLIFWGGAYMFQYSGGFKGDVYDETAVAYGQHIGGGSVAKVVDPIASGKRLYTVNCASCHQAGGGGVAGQYPPVAGADLVLSQGGYGENHLVKVMLHGLVGPLQVSGAMYNGNMPGWAGSLKDEQIAHILTFMRQEWGNQAGAISKEGIAAIRAEMASRTDPWTDAELRKIPAAAVAVGAAPAAEPAKK